MMGIIKLELNNTMLKKVKISLITLCVAFFVSNPMLSQNEELLFSPKGIAEVRITLSNGKTIKDIKNEKNDPDYAGKLDATIVIKNSNSSSYDANELFKGKIQIDGRGNTTWGVPKRPYNIDLIDNAGEENPAPLLGMPSADEWSLLAFWHDRSLMRIPLAMYLGRKMNGIYWTPKMQYVELWINNEYRGLYCLSEKIERGDNRIKVKKLTDAEEDQIEPRVSGGYILEGSTEGKLKEIEKKVQFKTSSGINFTFKYPKPKNITEAQRNWIISYLDEFETMLNSKDFNDPVNGYQKYINEESFIDWTILHELSKGVDNLFHASTFVHKDRNGKLNMSAPWDFDLSFGNSGVYSEDEAWVRKHRWFGQLRKDERYAKKYNERFDELMPLFNLIPEILEANYKQLDTNGVLEREEYTWPQILMDFQDAEDNYYPTTYKGHVRWLSEWIESRNVWTYIDLGLTDAEKAERLKKSRPVIRIMEPEFFDSKLSFKVNVMRGFSYVWNDLEQPLSNHARKITEKGKYTVQIKDNKGNVSLPSNVLIFGDFTGIENPLSRFDFTCSNPSSNTISLNYASQNTFALNVKIYDIRGSLLKESSINVTPGYNQLELNIPGLKKGIYLLGLTTDSEYISRKIIVSK